MAGWNLNQLEELPIYQAGTLAWFPRIVQGFTTRQGGVGSAPYDTLNLSLNCGDDQRAVAANRERLGVALGVTSDRMVFAEQVHGARVAIVDGPRSSPVQGADALVTDIPGLMLVILCADCMPIYIVEPVNRVVALIHCGWRGAAADIVSTTISVLKERFGVRPRACYAAIGPSIGPDSYEVGSDVADRFRSTAISGSSTPVTLKSDLTGAWNLNLRSVAFTQLLIAGLNPASIAICDEDTFANEREFFSHRRESLHGGKTGRMAAFFGLEGSTI